MIENTPNNDNLDNYLLGKLSADEKSAMDAQFAADSQLKEDMLLQQDIVHALQDERRLELKNRLNSIEVGVGGFSTAVGYKIAAGIALIGLLGTGAFFYFNNDEPVAKTETPVAIEALPAKDNSAAQEIPAQPEVPAVAEAQQATDISSEQLPEAVAAKPAVTKSTTTPSRAKVPQPTIILKTEAAPKHEAITTERPQITIQKPQVLSDFSENEINSTQPTEIPVDAMARNREFSTQTIEVTAQLHDKWDFHYQFYDSKLFIYGDFKSKPYEILEINTEGNTNYYLYFESQYYALKSNQLKLVRLRKLTNDKLIKELDITRNKKY